jgi:hypothetical protein
MDVRRLSATEYEIRKAARKSLRERCQESELKHVEELEWIEAHSENHRVRSGCCSIVAGESLSSHMTGRAGWADHFFG